MPARRNTRKQANAPLFITIVVILLIALFVTGILALRTWTTYSAHIKVTPTPSPTVCSVAVTHDPNLVTPTPAPTQVLLSVNTEGDAVKAVQERLKELGFYSGDVDGQFGSQTKAAVKLFQTQHGLDADGIVGDNTRAVLNSDQAKMAVVTPTPAAVQVLAGDVPLLINRQNTIDKHFLPADLVNMKDYLPSDLIKVMGSDIKGVKEAADALIELLRAAQAEDITGWQMSAGYRSYSYQQELFNKSVQEYVDKGFTKANATSATRQTVADPGASEHHTGLAFDFTVAGEYFSDTANYQWMLMNCWDYGFILRYADEKQEITGYLGEEWHYRYVGKEHSLKIKELGMCLEEYLETLKK